MVAWLIAISLFWSVAALYLGGMNVTIEGGGGVRQTLGLLATFVLFLVAWWGLRQLLAGLGTVLGGVILPTALAILGLPLLARIGFRLTGVRVHRGEGQPAHH